MVIIVISSIAGAALVAPVSVLAISAGGIHSTIASIILSLMLQAGVAPVNQSYLTALNTSYGYTIETAISEGLLTESAGTLVDTGLSSAIESASAYTDLGLSEIFTTTLDDAGVIAGSGAVNIANTAIHVGTAGTIGAFAGAVAIGVGVGILANHLWDRFGGYIKYGISIMTPDDMMELIPNGGYIGHARYFASSTLIKDYYIFSSIPFMTAKYSLGNGSTNYIIVMSNDGDASWRIYNNEQLNNTGTSSYRMYSGRGQVITDSALIDDNFNGKVFNNQNEYDTYIRNLRNGDEVLNLTRLSPDIIGPEGNQQYDSDNDTYPGIANQLDEGEDMMPVSMNDYQTFADNANNNTEDGNTGQDNADLFNDLIDLLIVDAPTIPDEPIIPDSPVDVPTVPDRPVVPEQPTIPSKPDVTQEEIDEALEGVTTIDLRSVFPFCIPFDIYNIILIFDTGENRRAPHITFVFPLTEWEIDVDLAVFDPVAGILRVLELILFIIGLAVATRSLIGAGG